MPFEELHPALVLLSAASRVGNVPRFLRLPVLEFTLLE
jgi:hypothetical protein